MGVAWTGRGGPCKAKASSEDPPTTFISLLVASVGTSISAPPVWADSSVGRKPRLSIKLKGGESKSCFSLYSSTQTGGGKGSVNNCCTDRTCI